MSDPFYADSMESSFPVGSERLKWRAWLMCRLWHIDLQMARMTEAFNSPRLWPPPGFGQDQGVILADTKLTWLLNHAALAYSLYGRQLGIDMGPWYQRLRAISRGEITPDQCESALVGDSVRKR